MKNWFQKCRSLIGERLQKMTTTKSTTKNLPVYQATAKSELTEQPDLPDRWSAAQKEFFNKMYNTAVKHPAGIAGYGLQRLSVEPKDWNTLCHNFAWLAVEVGRGTKRLEFDEADGWIDIA